MIFKSKKTLFTVVHDLIVLYFSFFLALWLRLEKSEIDLLIIFLHSKIWIYVSVFSVSNIVLLKRFGLYQGMWRYASTQEILSIFKSLIISTLLLVAVIFLDIRLNNIPRSFPLLLFIVSFLSISGPRFLYRIVKDNILVKKFKENLKIPVLVVGEDDATELFIRATSKEKTSPFTVVGIIAVKKSSIGRSIHGIPIIAMVEKIENLKKIVSKLKVSPQRMIIANHNLSSEILESLFIFCKNFGISIGEIPKITDFKTNNQNNFRTKPVIIEDILGRSQKVHNTSSIKKLSRKIILVTGAGGSIGEELCSQISNFKPKKIILFDQSEYNLYKISQKLHSKNILPILGDVKDYRKLEKIIKYQKPDLIFHTAALKHITFVESDPLEALKTNFLSTVNLTKLSIDYSIPKLVFISTDKAVNPTNVMGATKRLCEKYIQMVGENTLTSFQIVRFGNVLGSTGSVVPLFQKQIQEGGPLTITHPKITRYFMTIREAVELVLISSIDDKIENGVIKILEMGSPVKIKDLAEKMIILSGKKPYTDISIKYTKLRPGEKLFEELFYKNEEIERTSIQSIVETKSKLFEIEEKKIIELIKSINENNEKKSLELLKINVPEYKEVNEES